jgi:hypothetical protein
VRRITAACSQSPPEIADWKINVMSRPKEEQTRKGANHSVLQRFWSDHLLEHSEATNEPQKTYKWPWKIKVSAASSRFVCVPLWSRVTFEFWEMLKNASEVTLIPKIFFSYKFWTLCKVSWSAK